MNRLLLGGALGLILMASTDCARGAEVAYKNGAWQWIDSAWEGGVKPGPSDTAVIPELPVLKSRYEAGTMQSNGLVQDEEIQAIHFMDLYGITINGGGRTLTLNGVVCDDMTPSVEDTAQVATNRLSMTTLAFKGSTNELYVGNQHVLDINAPFVNRAEGSILLKKGAGTLVHSGQSWGAITAPVWVQEGEYVRSGNGYPEFRGDVVVGGCGHAATVTVTESAAQSVIIKPSILDIRPLGRVNLPGLGKYYYQETLRIDHGVLDGGGGTSFCMYNDSDTEITPEYVFDGGVALNATIIVAAGGALTIKPSESMSGIYGSLTFYENHTLIVPNGDAPIDFLVSGDFSGANRDINKDGDGTLVIRCGETFSTWGGAAGKPFNVYAGEMFLECSDTGIGLGTNNVIVAAGATYGGVGRHVGAEVHLRGRWGNVTLNGEEGKTATFAIGRKDERTGKLLPGRYVMGSTEQENDLTFNTNCTLRIGATAEGVSGLVVNGTFTLSGNDVLAIEGPEDLYELTPGTYELVRTSQPMNLPFASVTYNGGALPSKLKVRATDTLITLRVSPKGFSIIVR